MKLIIIFYIIAGFSAYIFNTTQAAPNQEIRQKRYLAFERCPENSTPDECILYAEEKSKQTNACRTFETDGNVIHWQGCGKVYCGENTRLIEEDLTKSYPDCCEHCGIIDEDREAYLSLSL